jgi:hypothetical protein
MTSWHVHLACVFGGAFLRNAVPQFVNGVMLPWYVYLAYFLGGAFLANAVPHFVSGVCGQPFPSPFASPPGKGLSSPLINVLWGAFNFVVAYLLIARVGDFHFRDGLEVLVLAAGGVLQASLSAIHFGRVNRER